MWQRSGRPPGTLVMSLVLTQQSTTQLASLLHRDSDEMNLARIYPSWGLPVVQEPHAFTKNTTLLLGHTPEYRNNSHIGAYSLSDCHNRTFSNVILTRAASNIGRQHSWTYQIPTVCRSASTERSTLSSFWLGAELLTTTRTSISTEDWQPHGKSRPPCCSSRFRLTFTYYLNAEI